MFVIIIIRFNIRVFPEYDSIMDNMKKLSVTMHETLDVIEQLIEHHQYAGNLNMFYSLIDSCSSTREDNSVIQLLDYIANTTVPTREFWLKNLLNLVNCYFHEDSRNNIRIKALEVLFQVFLLNR